MLSDNEHDVLNLQDNSTTTKDVLATTTTVRIIGKLRDMAAHSSLQVQTMGSGALTFPTEMKITAHPIHMGITRFSPSAAQTWLTGKERPDPMNISFSEIKMREGSHIGERMWSIIQFCYMEFQDNLADIQAEFSTECAYMFKALKEDERRQAQHIFANIQVMLGNRGTICIYRRTRDGNDHRNIHCTYSPCYLHSWKYYETSQNDNGDYVTTMIPGSMVHLNGECHDDVLNVVSQDGKVFEPAIRVDRATQDAALGRNSRTKDPTTFRRSKCTTLPPDLLLLIYPSDTYADKLPPEVEVDHSHLDVPLIVEDHLVLPTHDSPDATEDLSISLLQGPISQLQRVIQILHH